MRREGIARREWLEVEYYCGIPSREGKIGIPLEDYRWNLEVLEMSLNCRKGEGLGPKWELAHVRVGMYPPREYIDTPPPSPPARCRFELELPMNC